MRLVHCFFFIACLIVAGCATSIPVETDYDPEQDFASLQKYAWHDQVHVLDPLVGDRIRGAIDSALAALGFIRIDPGEEPDFRVSFTAVAEQASRVSTTSPSMGYRHSRWAVGDSPSHRFREYTRGTLIIDIIDPSGKELLWRGVSARSLEEGRSPEEKASDVREIVIAILQKFPPKSN
ncbi:MAG: DUF4136 domain-containing protein [Gammaproteobacteria bacterium]|nr:MAG: DUF4136 domain-containing protein [Gammaproteobacteria bacterium]